MTNFSPTLFLEINNSSIIFSAGKNDEFDNFKLIDSLEVPLDGMTDSKISDIKIVLNILKKNIYKIEKKFNFSFNEVVLILENFDFKFINLLGFKKLNGSQILRENITYIINALKSYVNDIESDKTIIHIFNSSFRLDDVKVENLPIGLFGNLYSHELSFTLINNNDLKNIESIFENCNLKIKKILNKSFVKGAYISNNNNSETFLYIKICNEISRVFYFENNSLKFEQKFEFGSNIIIRDISKITSLNADIIRKILIKEKFNEMMSSSETVEKEFFVESNYRKIRKNLIYQIAFARIKEITEILFKKNINLCHYYKSTKNVFLECDDRIHLRSFEGIFKTIILSEKKNVNYINVDDFPNSRILNTAYKLVHFGWKKEAIPVTQPQKSIMGKIFDAIFN